MMTEEMKAFKRIRDDIEIGYLHIDNVKDKQNYLGLLDIIGTTLIAYDIIDNKIFNLLKKFRIINRQDLLNNLKALEVIKDKKVALSFIKEFSFVHDLTQEEIDLLVKVLL